MLPVMKIPRKLARLKSKCPSIGYSNTMGFISIFAASALIKRQQYAGGVKTESTVRVERLINEICNHGSVTKTSSREISAVIFSWGMMVSVRSIFGKKSLRINKRMFRIQPKHSG